MAAQVMGVLRNATLTIDGDNHAAFVKKARLVPDVTVQTYKTLVPSGVIQDVDAPTWALELQGVQDWGTDGLARALHDGHGTNIVVVLAPKAGTGQRQATCTVVAMSVPFGGESGEFAEFDVTLAVVGTPTFADAS